ncbi:MAG: hypothetical protein QOG23_5241 [Blastocatellia bacterium]|nr:hypothetical protein [Blastocatellia bacterium]
MTRRSAADLEVIRGRANGRLLGAGGPTVLTHPLFPATNFVYEFVDLEKRVPIDPFAAAHDFYNRGDFGIRLCERAEEVSYGRRIGAA